MKETQDTIGRWADDTFGGGPTFSSIVARGNVEMAELLLACATNMPVAKIIEEAADVCIVMMRLADVAGHDLGQAIDAKMAVNRQRQWVKDGYGNGYHVAPRPRLANAVA